MKLYLVSATKDVDWDETDAFVCVVNDEEDIQKLFDTCADATTISTHHSIMYVGVTDVFYRPIVICESVKWG